MAFINGVDTAALQITSLGTQVGSWLGNAGTLPNVADIIVAKNGSVIKVETIVDVNTYSYSVLQADAADVQAGMEYPNVVRQLQDDGIANPLLSEWYYYDNGGAYPWVPLPIIWFNPAGSNTIPYDTKAKGATLMTVALAFQKPGDALIISDGTYTAGNNGWDCYHDDYLESMWDFVAADSGTSENPKTFQAETDGGVVIDAEYLRATLQLMGTYDTETYIGIDGPSHLIFKGFTVKNSTRRSIYGVGGCTDVTFQRVGAINADDTGINYHQWQFDYGCSYFLIEDCYGVGDHDSATTRVVFMAYYCDFIIYRRFYARAELYISDEFHIANPSLSGWQCYNSSDCTFENLFTTFMQPRTVDLTDPLSYYLGKGGGADWGYQKPADRNSFYGNINIGDNIIGNEIGGNNRGFGTSNDPESHGGEQEESIFENCVSIDTGRMGIRTANDVTVWPDGKLGSRWDQMTLVQTNKITQGGLLTIGVNDGANSYELPYGQGHVYIKNSTIETADSGMVKHGINALSWEAEYNCLWDVTYDYSAGISVSNSTFNTVQPNRDIATYGNGAYLIRPSNLIGTGKNGDDIGAEVLYETVNGVVTDTPLWPWPMEDRIIADTGISVTYSEDPGGSAATYFAGPWKTLAGVYP